MKVIILKDIEESGIKAGDIFSGSNSVFVKWLASGKAMIYSEYLEQQKLNEQERTYGNNNQ